MAPTLGKQEKGSCGIDGNSESIECWRTIELQVERRFELRGGEGGMQAPPLKLERL